MNVQHPATSALGRSDARHESETRLPGRWLFLIRAAWVVLTLLILVLNIAALPHDDAVLQSVCAVPAQCFGEQLTATQAHSLQTLGVSMGAYAAVYVAVYGLSVLVWVLLGALLFWRRSDEPMALFCSFMLVSFVVNALRSERILPSERAVCPQS